MGATSKIRDLRIKRPDVKDDEFPRKNVTTPDDRPDDGDNVRQHRRRSSLSLAPAPSPPNPDPQDPFPPDPYPDAGSRPGRDDDWIRRDDADWRKRAIPKFKNLLPKTVITLRAGVAALAFDCLF